VPPDDGDKTIEDSTVEAKEHTPEVLAWRKILAKRREENKRYEKEKVQYNTEMRQLRIKFAQEVKELNEEKARKAKEADEINRLNNKKRNEMVDEYLAKVYPTKLEAPIFELLKKTPEEMEIERLQKRKEKLERRAYTVEKLRQEREKKHKESDALLFALAQEASVWITKSDIEDGTLEEKIKSKMEKIQPITAAYQSILPKHHTPDAQLFVTPHDDSMQRFL